MSRIERFNLLIAASALIVALSSLLWQINDSIDKLDESIDFYLNWSLSGRRILLTEQGILMSNDAVVNLTKTEVLLPEEDAFQVTVLNTGRREVYLQYVALGFFDESGEHFADLRLKPPPLGQLEIKPGRSVHLSTPFAPEDVPRKATYAVIRIGTSRRLFEQRVEREALTLEVDG